MENQYKKTSSSLDILQLVKEYKYILEKNMTVCSIQNGNNLEHALWMLNQIEYLNSSEKKNRWMGFVQGLLYSCRIYTIDELRGQVKRCLK